MGLPEDTSADSFAQTTPSCVHLIAKWPPPAKPIGVAMNWDDRPAAYLTSPDIAPAKMALGLQKAPCAYGGLSRKDDST